MEKQVANGSRGKRHDVEANRPPGDRTGAAPVPVRYSPATNGAVAALLRGGGVAVLPTDTIYGLHCLASNAGAVDRVRGLKGRGAAKGFILLCADATMAETVVARWPGNARRALGDAWPAALTAILPASRRLRADLRPDGVVAGRVPDLDDLRAIIRIVGEPIVSTSVNRAGEPPRNDIRSIRRDFPAVDACVARGRGGGRRSSTIVDWRGKQPVVVRRGGFPFDERGADR